MTRQGKLVAQHTQDFITNRECIKLSRNHTKQETWKSKFGTWAKNESKTFWKNFFSPWKKIFQHKIQIKNSKDLENCHSKFLRFLWFSNHCDSSSSCWSVFFCDFHGTKPGIAENLCLCAKAWTTSLTASFGSLTSFTVLPDLALRAATSSKTSASGSLGPETFKLNPIKAAARIKSLTAMVQKWKCMMHEASFYRSTSTIGAFIFTKRKPAKLKSNTVQN